MTKYKDAIHLTPVGLTKSTTLHHAFLLILREKDGERLLPVILNADEYRRLEAALSKDDTSETYLARRFNKQYGITVEAVILTRGTHDQFRALCISTQNEERKILELDTATGIITAIGLKAPLMIVTKTFNELYDKQPEEGRVAIPVTAMTDDLLTEALELAVAEENYELASKLRDELRNREA